MRKYLWAVTLAVLTSGLILYLSGRLPHRPIELAWTTGKADDTAKVELTHPLLIVPKTPKFLIDPIAPIELLPEPPESAVPPTVNDVVPVPAANPQPPRFHMPYADEVEEPSGLESWWKALTDFVEKMRPRNETHDAPEPN